MGCCDGGLGEPAVVLFTDGLSAALTRRRRAETLVAGAEGHRRPLDVVAQHKDKTIETSAVVDTVLDELKNLQGDLTVKDLQQGRIQVYSTVKAGLHQIANNALERGLLA